MTEERNSPEYLKQGLDEGRFVVGYVLEDHFERDLVEAALSDADVPFATRLTGESEFGLIFEDAQGYGTILVRTEDKPKVDLIVTDLRQSDEEAAETVKQMFDQGGDGA